MSLLPNNTYANPANSFYGEGGGGAAGELQSPAVVLPDETAQGNVSLTMAATDPTANSTLFINSADGLAVLNLDANSTGGAFLNMNGLNGAPFFVTNATGQAPFQYIMRASPTRVGQTSFLTYDPSAATLTLGDSLPAGAVITNNDLLVQAAPTNGNAVRIQSTSGTTANIFNTVADAGGLLFGSSAACPATLAVVDTAGVGSQFVAVGNGIGTTNLRLQGGSTGQPIPIVNTSAASTGALNIGPSVINQGLIALTDTGITPNQGGVVNVNGTAIVNGTTTVTGSITANNIVLTALPSSSIQVAGQGGSGQPPVGITINRTQTKIGNPELQPAIPSSYNGGIVGQTSFNFNINSTGQPAGVIGNTGAEVGGPGSLGDLAWEGLYIVSLICSNASTDIYSKLAQIKTVSYWNPTTGWFGGSGGASVFGGAEFRAGINPSNVIAAGQLWVTNTSGNNWTGMTTNLTQITGVIPGYFVA